MVASHTYFYIFGKTYKTIIMKNLKAITLFFLGLVLVACSSDDDSGDDGPSSCDTAIENLDTAFTDYSEVTSTDANYVSICNAYQDALQNAIDLCGDASGTYQALIDSLDCTLNFFPSNVDDFWIYNVINRNEDDSTFNFDATDLLTVNSVTASSFTVEANGGATPAAGSMNSFLVNGTLSKIDNMLLYSGDLALPEAFAGFSDETITLTDIALYDLDADNGELSNTPGTITQDLDVGGSVFPLTINYSFITSKLSSGSTLTVDGTEYNNVIKGNLRLEVTVTAAVDILGTITNIDVLNRQDILTIDYYFSQGIGLIQANAVQGYEVAATFISILETFGIPLELPTAVTVTNDQELDSYVISE